jgi:hypothetical protein
MNKSYDTYPLLTKVTDLKGSMFRLFGNVFFYIVFRLETIRVSSKFVVRRKWPVLIFGQVLGPSDVIIRATSYLGAVLRFT